MTQIDVSKVPTDKQTHPDFLKLKTQMEQALSKQKWIKAFCIHEAGHMTYFSQMGVIEYEFLGPRITYRQETDTFDGYMASVKPKTFPAITSLGQFQLFLTTVAKAYVAGKIFTQALTAAPT